MMKLIDRHDTPLAIALIVGVATMFAQPLRFILSVAEDVSRTYRVDLVPGLIIFVLVFTVHFWRKYRDAATQAQLAAHDAEQARKTADVMEKLVTASKAMGSASDRDALRMHATTHLPQLLGDTAQWLALTQDDEWFWLIPPDRDADTLIEAAPTLLRRVDAGPCVHGDWTVFPVGTATGATGLLGVAGATTRSATDNARIGAVGAVIGVAARNVKLFEELQIASATDFLTGCVTRAVAFETLANELRRARRSDTPLVVLMVDVDRFKDVNDKYGHTAGDKLLASVGETLRHTLRSSDVKCRYGGDEFLVILPDTPLEGAELVSATLRKAVEGIRIEDPSGLITCNISIGMAAAQHSEVDPVSLVHRADMALYRDKARRSNPGRTIAIAAATIQ